MTTVDQPLRGRRIVVTRTREQAGGLVDLLHSLGAVVTVIPLISTVPTATPEEIAATAAEVRSTPAPRWIAFTSATAVRLVLGAAGVESLEGMLVATVGPATAAAVEAAGVVPDVIAGDNDASGLGNALLERGVVDATVWFPCAEGAGASLTDALTAAGATVIVQQIYRSAMPDGAPGRLQVALRDGIDAITLTSGSTARHLAGALGDSLPAAVAIICIGRQTASEASAAGLPVHGVATDPSAEGLAAALVGCLAPQPLR